MNNLVFINNGKTVTDSLTVAEKFNKDHRNVMRDIEVQLQKLNEAGEREWGVLNFERTHYQHIQNGQWYQKFEMTEEAFAIVAMGYVTPEAMKMKVKFLEEFKWMRNQMTNNSFGGFSKEIQAILLLDQRSQEHSDRIERLENTTTIDFGQQKQLQKAGQAKVTRILGGKKTEAYSNSSLRSKVYSALWNDYQYIFEINSYCNTYKKDFQDGLSYVKSWTAPAYLMKEIEAANGQLLF